MAALYRYTIEPLSAFATPLRSDTLYGHLLWRAAEQQGDAAVSALIAAFENGTPPFKLSSAFPRGCLPVPALPPVPRQQFRKRFAAEGGAKLADTLKRYKTFRKIAFVREEKLLSLCHNLSQENLFSAWLDDPDGFAPSQKTQQIAEQPHNSIDRFSGKVLSEGGLYFSRATWYAPKTTLDLYVETQSPQSFETLLDAVCKTGYGANSSTGKGHFCWQRDTSFDATRWPQTGNARLLLSVTAAPSFEAFSGYYQPFVKQGRAWSDFGEKNPYKKPFMALNEGAVLTRMPQSGYVLKNLHSNPDLVQVLWPVVLPVTLGGCA